jgi:hypothetical protein
MEIAEGNFRGQHRSVEWQENSVPGAYQTASDRGGADKNLDGKKPRDAWLRKGTPTKPSLQLLGPQTSALHRDLQWWMPDGGVAVVENNVVQYEGSSLRSPDETDTPGVDKVLFWDRVI